MNKIIVLLSSYFHVLIELSLTLGVPARAHAGLNRCGKSCRLRWTNYLRPDLKHDGFSPEEEDLIINLHKIFGSRFH